MLLPVTEIPSTVVTASRSTCPEAVTVSPPPSVTAFSETAAPVIVRSSSFFVPPAAPESVTSPVAASSVSDSPPTVLPFTVELNVMSPSVELPSVSIVMSAPTITARAKVRSVPSTVISPFSVVVLPAVCISVRRTLQRDRSQRHGPRP